MSENFIARLPERFTRNALDLCGESGENWLKELPRIIEELEAKWSVRAEKPFENLSYNYVAPCVCENGEAVLKIALPLNNPEIYNEAKFLQTADGKGAVKLLETDISRRAILLERLSPGANLKEVCREDEAEAVTIAIQVMRKILKQPPENSVFLRLEDWFKGFEKAANTKFPGEYIFKARDFYEELSNDPKSKFLIHGDLHHENILSAGREPFLAIDPKGIVGDIGYEIGVFLNNHLWWLASEPDLKEKLSEAVRQFSEAFEIEPRDLIEWAFAQIVLSAWWAFEENGDNWKMDLELTEIWDL